MRLRKVPAVTILMSIVNVLLIAAVTRSVLGEELALTTKDCCRFQLVRIESGKFEMGRHSPAALATAALSFGDQGDSANQGPVRKIRISQPFLMAKFKVTTEQYCKFLNSTNDPERFVSINRFSNIELRDALYHPKDGRSAFPVNVAPWKGAQKFCEWLSDQSGRAVRLPTEAEWEFVARGAEGRKAPWGSKSVVNWSSLEGRSVDEFPDNVTPDGVRGLVDLVVAEWCSDFYGVRYIAGDTTDPSGPTVKQLPVQSDLPWLANVKGEFHVLRGRVKSSYWSTTSRDFGDKADGSGIYGFRFVVAESHEPK